MQVSPPAVTEMIKKLISEDLIIKDKVKGHLSNEKLVKSMLLNSIGNIASSKSFGDHLQYTCDLIHQEAEICIYCL